MLLKIYSKLLKEHGHRKWWPVSGFTEPKGWEICIGAVLTQNTAWKNVEKALSNLKNANCTTVDDIFKIDVRKLRKLIRPSGFFNQKTKRLKIFSRYIVDNFGSVENFLKNVTREELLKVNGIGPETADAILLYACNKPYFVVDAYTERIFSRLGIIDESWKYEQVRELFENNLPRDVKIYQEFHALIVKHAKECCKKVANENCILKLM